MIKKERGKTMSLEMQVIIGFGILLTEVVAVTIYMIREAIKAS